MKAAFLCHRLIVLLPLMALLAVSAVTVSTASAAEGEEKGWLGVSLQRLTSDLREAMDVSAGTGVLVTDVVEDSPAEAAGIQVGDVILKYDDKTVTSPRRLSRLVRKTAPGTKMKVKIFRDGKEKTLTAEIEKGKEKKICSLKLIGESGEEDLLFTLGDDIALFGLPGLSWCCPGPDLWLGVHTVDLSDQLAKYFDIKDGQGVLISEVLEDSPAEKAGLKAGDVIVKADGERIEDTPDLHEAIGEHKEGEEIGLVVIRDGKEKKLKATLEESPHKAKMKVGKKLDKLRRKLTCKKMRAPGLDMPEIRVEVEKELADTDWEELEARLEELEEELKRVKDKLKMD